MIRRSLESLDGVADEIILVHDGPCTDATVSIAEDTGCRVFVREAVGDPEFHTVFAYEQAHGDWILSVDGDEFLSTEMAAVIPQLIEDPTCDAWAFFWPMWNGRRYITRYGPHKPVLFRRASLSMVGLLQSAEQVRGPLGRRPEQLHHQPLYNNFTLRSVKNKYRHWCRIHAGELVRPFADLPKFNYSGPNRWPWHRHVMNVLSPILAIPNGFAHFLLVFRDMPGEDPRVVLRLAAYQWIYATLLQFYVARYVYLNRPRELLRRRRRSDDVRLGA